MQYPERVGSKGYRPDTGAGGGVVANWVVWSHMSSLLKQVLRGYMKVEWHYKVTDETVSLNGLRAQKEGGAKMNTDKREKFIIDRIGWLRRKQIHVAKERKEGKWGFDRLHRNRKNSQKAQNCTGYSVLQRDSYWTGKHSELDLRRDPGFFSPP